MIQNNWKYKMVYPILLEGLLSCHVVFFFAECDTFISCLYFFVDCCSCIFFVVTVYLKCEKSIFEFFDFFVFFAKSYFFQSYAFQSYFSSIRRDSLFCNNRADQNWDPQRILAFSQFVVVVVYNFIQICKIENNNFN